MKKRKNEFLDALNQLTPEQREELRADSMAAQTLVEMGTPIEKVLALFHGRQGVYGRFPYMEFLKRAVAPKKEKPKAKIISVRELRKKREQDRRRRIEQLEKERIALRRRAA